MPLQPSVGEGYEEAYCLSTQLEYTPSWRASNQCNTLVEFQNLKFITHKDLKDLLSSKSVTLISRHLNHASQDFHNVCIYLLIFSYLLTGFLIYTEYSVVMVR